MDEKKELIEKEEEKVNGGFNASDVEANLRASRLLKRIDLRCPNCNKKPNMFNIEHMDEHYICFNCQGCHKKVWAFLNGDKIFHTECL